MKILFGILIVLFFVACAFWLYSIINRRTREDGVYLLWLIVILFLNVAIQIVNIMI